MEQCTKCNQWRIKSSMC